MLPARAAVETYEYADMPHSHILVTGSIIPPSSQETRMLVSLPRPGDRRASTILGCSCRATRIRTVAAERSYLLLAGGYGTGNLFVCEPRPIEALAQARCRSVACGGEHLVATLAALRVAGAAGPTAGSGTTRSAAWRGRESSKGREGRRCRRAFLRLCADGRRRGVRVRLLADGANSERAIATSA